MMSLIYSIPLNKKTEQIQSICSIKPNQIELSFYLSMIVESEDLIAVHLFNTPKCSNRRKLDTQGNSLGDELHPSSNGKRERSPS